MEKKEELMKAFATSIEMEEKGREFYLKSAKECRNELGKRVFEALADDETRHIVAIKGYCENISKKDKAPQLCKVMPRHKTIDERLIFGKREAETLKNTIFKADELKAYQIAMKMENEGYAFYKKVFESVSDPEIKELYKFLLSEEESHFEMISNTYEYLKDPAAWFASQEKPIVEG
ncbi:MAG: ferritin family protein [Candidatus Omnitrophota bacterium]